MAVTVVAGESPTNRGFTGYVGQFDGYEGLTCNLMEWLKSSSSGKFIEDDKSVSLTNTNPSARAMLERVHGWVYEKNITSFDAMFYQESQALVKWQSRNALFMRNWPYAVSVTNAVQEFPEYGLARLPGITANQSGAATIGGWHLGVSKYSPNVEAAVRVLQFLTSPEVQKARAIRQGVLPTHKSLYDGTYLDQTLPFREQG
ncbi:hypothetical protein HK104_006745 [Borealophlyctis nickersoniae]|nr:hypothetical protein HK104_006745 [Borealophlyctis nickersoniae]